ncbi:MAG: DUF502 domain-containing protein [Candidatus Marinimicrobia bacterium]|jgi:uncharacterized membrane protein|nr:DUF502 domain-containing protein [Candidatus Neomarinimicrobiota bacterium]MBT3500813.1 DUF502 domain-containing protein [Candidatus Neomarinimicrobiota bacterium]MBT3838847.1 DUF502 domain-containing protein [Candidatus Neomarinimicrobiota bacterium]MBT3998824.1 DUF502 domain-containing protein [Candidatus Neomarinimicrobiota bacterium]MBT4282857.1 DUF502 domain-containing protein [Candidatus Neomarinimicrobiota bacterium]
MNSIIQNIRTKLFAGIATALPLLFTYFLLEFLFVSLDELSAPILEKFGIEIPGLGIVLTLVLILFLGILVTNFLGRKIFDLGEKILKRVPIVNTIYSTLKQITDTFTKGTSDTFQGAVYIQYPRVGLWTMAFISGESKTNDGVPYYHLFVPTTPNPTSGFFLLIPQADAVPTGMSVEDGLKTIISGGMLAPDVNPLP